MPAMKTFHFVLILDGPDLMADENIDALFEAGCDDATFGVRDNVQQADFDRDAPTFADAVITAIRDVKRAVPSAEILRVEPDEFVSLAAIAARVGMSREGVRSYSIGRTGPGSFPAPVTWIDQKNRVWRWTDVIAWFQGALGRTVGSLPEAETIAALNGLIETKRHLVAAPAADRDAVAGFVREDSELKQLLVV